MRSSGWQVAAESQIVMTDANSSSISIARVLRVTDSWTISQFSSLHPPSAEMRSLGG
jgi:hypothetical protein